MQNTRCNAYVIVIPVFSESESDTEDDIPSILNDILGISNWKTDTIGLSEICHNRLP